MNIIDADWYETMKELEAIKHEFTAEEVEPDAKPLSMVATPPFPHLEDLPYVDYSGMFDFPDGWLQFWCEVAHTPSCVLRRDLLLFNPKLSVSDNLNRAQLVVLYLKHHPLADEARRRGWEVVKPKG
jgi:hypothetical protein